MFLLNIFHKPHVEKSDFPETPCILWMFPVIRSQCDPHRSLVSWAEVTVPTGQMGKLRLGGWSCSNGAAHITRASFFLIKGKSMSRFVLTYVFLVHRSCISLRDPWPKGPQADVK